MNRAESQKLLAVGAGAVAFGYGAWLVMQLASHRWIVDVAGHPMIIDFLAVFLYDLPLLAVSIALLARERILDRVEICAVFAAVGAFVAAALLTAPLAWVGGLAPVGIKRSPGCPGSRCQRRLQMTKLTSIQSSVP